MSVCDGPCLRTETFILFLYVNVLLCSAMMFGEGMFHFSHEFLGLFCRNFAYEQAPVKNAFMT